jgi:CO/xanthine dehydrogenase FAD-binding subunit
MVALAAGRLPRKPYLSIAHLRELRFIQVEPTCIVLGAGTTFTDLRRHADIASDLPLLVQAASWTGSIANQNRGTLGGNLVNASPAADSPPALLCYDAQLTFISAHGTRTLPYTDFHLAYKKTALRPDELLFSITVPRAFAGYHHFLRKVGTRNAQAISKIALAALFRMRNNRIEDIRIAAASLSEIPLRCRQAESALTGQPLTPESIAAARHALTSEARPIDDIRSTAAYRAAVAANLLEDFLTGLNAAQNAVTSR